jgi:hypothetical protein
MSTLGAAGFPRRVVGFRDPRLSPVIAFFAASLKFCRLIGTQCRHIVDGFIAHALLRYLPSILCLGPFSIR